MAESPNEPDRPPKPPGKYLPRIVYKPPEPDPEADPELTEEEAKAAALEGKAAPKPKPKPTAKVEARPETGGSAAPAQKKPKPREAARKGPEKEKKGALVEETPEYETYDARRRVRMAVGAAASAVILLVVFVLFRTFGGSGGDDDESTGPGTTASPVQPPDPAKERAALEIQAGQLLEDAKRAEKAGQLEVAVARLEKIVTDYPSTALRKQVDEALERNRQGLPLFGGPAVLATKAPSKLPQPKKSVDDPESAPVVVEAVKPGAFVPREPPTVDASPPSSLAPFVRAEPRRQTGVGLTPKPDMTPLPLPAGFHARQEVGVHPSGWPLEITCDRDGSSMILIPGGTFTQGRDDGRPEEKPAHKVQLSPYYIDQHEVTVRQYNLARGKSFPTDDDRPMVGVTLPEARAYAQLVGKTIPTEAQWEMAARTTDGRMHPWGNQHASFDRPRQPKQIDLVMSFPSDLSPYGVFDLAGNAWEWTNDWFDTKAYQPFKHSTAVNPSGPPKGFGRIPEIVIKGGSRDWDASWRSGMRPDARLPYLGFRGVLNLGGGGPTVAPAGVNQGGGAVKF